MRETAPLWEALVEIDRRAGSLAPLIPLLSVSKTRGIVRYEELFPDRLVRAEDLSNYKLVEPGEIVLNKMSAATGAVGRASERGLVSPDYAVLRVASSSDSSYLSYLLSSDGFCKNEVEPRLQGIGVGDVSNARTPRVTMTSYLNPVVFLPPLATQQRIADYLDRETGEIDAMIVKMDQLTTVLEARRMEMVKHAFDSGAVTCTQTPLFALATSEDNRRIPLKAEDRGKMSGDYPYYGASGVIDHLDQYIWNNETRILVSEDGANLLARNHPIAFIATGQYWVNNHAHVLRPEAHVDPRLVCFAIAVTDIQHAVSGSAQPKLTADAMWRLKLPFPVNVGESTALADHLDEVTSRIDAMLAKVSELKSLLTERRAALITDVVTGRKEVA